MLTDQEASDLRDMARAMLWEEIHDDPKMKNAVEAAIEDLKACLPSFDNDQRALVAEFVSRMLAGLASRSLDRGINPETVSQMSVLGAVFQGAHLSLAGYEPPPVKIAE